jgi:hypothetical protein
MYLWAIEHVSVICCNANQKFCKRFDWAADIEQSLLLKWVCLFLLPPDCGTVDALSLDVWSSTSLLCRFLVIQTVNLSNFPITAGASSPVRRHKAPLGGVKF